MANELNTLKTELLTQLASLKDELSVILCNREFTQDAEATVCAHILGNIYKDRRDYKLEDMDQKLTPQSKKTLKNPKLGGKIKEVIALN